MPPGASADRQRLQLRLLQLQIEVAAAAVSQRRHLQAIGPVVHHHVRKAPFQFVRVVAAGHQASVRVVQPQCRHERSRRQARLQELARGRLEFVKRRAAHRQAPFGLRPPSNRHTGIVHRQLVRNRRLSQQLQLVAALAPRKAAYRR